MRSYPTDSPQAAGRLLAMAEVADGNYSFTELRALDRLDASRQLGLSPEAFKDVIETFCTDLLSAAHGEWTGSARMDEASRQQLLREVRDPDQRARVVALCQAVVQADGHEADGEAALLDALTRAWRDQPAGALS
ncbi:MAG: TerB family tellurite resistance protein [Rubrivivax sp.]|nr:MAG: TerB family tellurite resistance protein [Rubrivivax sp.]